ncbi:18258_t:CDS:1, partial [Funneliformis geosporum]
VGYTYKSNKIEFYWTYKIIKSNSPNDGVFISPIGPIAITVIVK